MCYRIRIWCHHYLQRGRLFFPSENHEHLDFYSFAVVIFSDAQSDPELTSGSPSSWFLCPVNLSPSVWAFPYFPGGSKMFQDHLVTFPAPVLESAASLRSPGGPFSGTRCLETTVWALGRPPLYDQQHLLSTWILLPLLYLFLACFSSNVLQHLPNYYIGHFFSASLTRISLILFMAVPLSLTHGRCLIDVHWMSERVDRWPSSSPSPSLEKWWRGVSPTTHTPPLHAGPGGLCLT